MPRSAPPSLGWRELADLPFAASLTVHAGALAPGEEYDGARFSHVDFENFDATRSMFLDCAFTQASFQRGALAGARFTQVWLRDVHMIGTGLARSSWVDAALVDSALAGVEASGSRLTRVVLRGCKLDAVNLREAVFSDVIFDDCLLRGVDFTGASLARTTFTRCRLSDVTFTRVSLDAVDLRGAELGVTIDPGSLRGAIVTSAQLADMMPMLAESMGIVVDDG